MPAINRAIRHFQKGNLNKKEIRNAPIIVIITSKIAILKIRYLCIPSFGFPNIFLYLQSDIIYYIIL
jgi:hypothetical protein